MTQTAESPEVPTLYMRGVVVPSPALTANDLKAIRVANSWVSFHHEPDSHAGRIKLAHKTKSNLPSGFSSKQQQEAESTYEIAVPSMIDPGFFKAGDNSVRLKGLKGHHSSTLPDDAWEIAKALISKGSRLALRWSFCGQSSPRIEKFGLEGDGLYLLIFNGNKKFQLLLDYQIVEKNDRQYTLLSYR
jgi:hypothetical protein